MCTVTSSSHYWHDAESGTTYQLMSRRLRAAIREALPQAEECFESRMPVYNLNGQWATGFALRSKRPIL